MQTSGCLPAPSGMAAMASERCTMAGATSTLCSSVRFVLGVARHCDTAPTYAVEQAAIIVQGVWRKRQGWKILMAAMASVWSKTVVWRKRQGWKMLMAAMASVWSKTVDPSTGAVYYYNYRTGEAKWEKPLLFGGKDVEDFAGHLEEMQKLSGRSRCCSEARTWRTSRANSKRCRPNNEKR